MKRMFSLLLVMLIALGAPTLPAMADGVYAEVSITLPEGYSTTGAMCQTPDGGFAVAARDVDGNWALISWPALGAEPSVLSLQHTGNDIEHLSIAPDGSILAMLGMVSTAAMQGGGAMAEGGDAQAGGMMRQSSGGEGDDSQLDGVMRQSAEGGGDVQGEGDEPRTFKLSMDDVKSELVWFDETGARVAGFEVTGYPTDVKALNGRRSAALLAMDGLIIYDEQGEELQRVGQGMVQAIASDGEALYALEQSKLTKYDVATGEKQGSMDLEMESSGALLCGADGGLYMMDVNGFYGLDIQSGETTQITGSMGMSFGDPNNGVSGLARLSDGSFAALLSPGSGGMGNNRTSIRIGSGDQSLLLGYQLREDIDPSQRQDFTITALRASAKLQKAAGDFQRLHPELNVQLQTQMSADDESPADDHIRTLNTDLLAGKGGDVLVLDGLPMDKYAQRGILTNIAETFKDVELLPGIRASATGADGTMYAIPTQFSFDMLWGGSEAIGALSTLEDLANIALPDGQTPFSAYTYEQWLDLFYPANQNLFMNESGKPDLSNPAFAQFLEALYALYQTQDELPDDTVTSRGVSQQAAIAMMNGATAFYPAQIASLNDLMLGYTISGGTASACAALPTLEGPSRGYYPSLMLGIGAQSQNKELAEEFIRLMLSPDVQQLDQGEGLPTVTSSLDVLFEEAMERASNRNIMAMITFDGANSIEMKQPDEQTLEAVRALIDAMDEQISSDDTLMGFIAEESDAFFAGRQSAEATAAQIAQRAWSYLNE